MDNQATKAKKRSVSYYRREEQIVSEFAGRRGLDFSSAQRYIINDWAKMRQGFVHSPGYPENDMVGEEAEVAG